MSNDPLDIASELTELHNQAALQRHQANQSEQKESAYWCIECDELIPHKRRLAIQGVQLCVHCQSALELKRKQGV